MTKTTKEIFEKHEVRKTPAQRKAFRDYLTRVAGENGYSAKCESVSKSCTNVIIGDPERARIVYTAHYDTCAVLPFPNFITPRCIPLYLLYQIVMSVALLFVPILLCFVIPELLPEEMTLLALISDLSGLALMGLIMYLTVAGPANKHTANDNTSGVTLLLDIMRDTPAEDRDKVAFIFFDLEEMGLIGSSGYRKKHRGQLDSTLLLNFDCISDGKTAFFAVPKRAHGYIDKIREAFFATEDHPVVIATKGYIYPSDQRNFKLGVGVCTLNSTRSGLLYMDKIHTKHDTVYDEENIAFLKAGAIRLISLI